MQTGRSAKVSFAATGLPGFHTCTVALLLASSVLKMVEREQASPLHLLLWRSGLTPGSRVW